MVNVCFSFNSLLKNIRDWVNVSWLKTCLFVCDKLLAEVAVTDVEVTFCDGQSCSQARFWPQKTAL